MSVVNPHIRFVYEDYKALPESMAKRYELLDGEILMVPAPTTKHQCVTSNILSWLHPFVRRFQLGLALCSPVDVVFGAGNAREIVQPDVIFVSRERIAIVVDEEIRGAPDFLVEVLSPGTETRDRTYKKHLYGRYGVREYWIVDPATFTVEIYKCDGSLFDSPEIRGRGEIITSALFPGLDIPVDEVFNFS